MSQNQRTKPAMDTEKAMKAIYQQSRSANAAAQQLQPLLSLLDQPEAEGEMSPVERLQDILEVLLLGQRQLHQDIEDLHAKVDALSKRRN